MRGVLHGVAALLALVAGVPAAAGAATARAVEWGELRAEVIGLIGPEANQRGLSPGLSTGTAEFTRRTDRIEARLCGQFGVAAALQAEPGVALPGMVQVRVAHPRLTRPDGVSGTESVLDTHVVPEAVVPGAAPGAPDGLAVGSYMFNYAWELEAGDWTFEFRDGDTLLLSKTFTVTVPAGAPRQGACGPAVVSEARVPGMPG